MSIEIKAHWLQERPSNRFLNWASRNALLRKVIFKEPFQDEIVRAEEGCRKFSRMLLLGLGVLDHPTLSEQWVNQQFISALTGNLFEEIFHPGPDKREGLDGRQHKIDENLWPYLWMSFPTMRNFSLASIEGYTDEEVKKRSEITFQMEKAIDLEARNILLTLIAPNFKSCGALGLFVEDFISSISRTTQNRYLSFINQDLREGVAHRLDRLEVELNKIRNPV